MLSKFSQSDLAKAPVDLAVLLLRIGSGAFIMTHGIPKVKKILAGDLGFADPIGLGPEVSLVLNGIFGSYLRAIDNSRTRHSMGHHSIDHHYAGCWLYSSWSRPVFWEGKTLIVYDCILSTPFDWRGEIFTGQEGI